MVTAEITGAVVLNVAQFAFKGLSTDNKPTNTYKGYDIKNGSSFFELDTQDIKFYDGDAKAWN